MDILYWNIRGACSKGLLSQMRLVCKNPKPCMVILSETKCQNESRLLSLKKLGFDGLVQVPSVGRSGGLVAVWKSDQVGVSVLRRDRQFLHLLCSKNGEPSFFLTAVYSLPLPHCKHELWQELGKLASIIVDPWVVAGDFNDIAHPSERVGGATPSSWRMNKFVERINECNLNDLGYSGASFTWRGPGSATSSGLFERLDRALANTSFLSTFEQCSVRVLPRVKFSDHNPICLCFGKDVVSRSVSRPFRFEAMWLHHQDYRAFLSEEWDIQGDLNLSLSRFQEAIRVWNYDVFGMVETRKNRILARLNGIQKSTAYPYSRYLCGLEINLQEDLQRILALEEVKWFQKSKDIWIKDGDRNTRYYHLKAKMRTRRNKIRALKSESGVWCSEEEDLKRLVVQHFFNLYCEEGEVYVPLRTRSNFPILDGATADRLGRVPSDEEIRCALFSIGSFKSPGIDGFPAIFYKSNWGTVGPSLCSFVKGVFRGNVPLEEANRTLISLIPKRDNPVQVSHFRPISLCTVHYKCITKVITLRLKEVMNDIVSPFQSSFIRGRHIHDNLIIGQEIMHIMNKNRSRKGLMAWKIDLEKAYDRIRWDFLKQVLTDVGFSKDFINLIVSCVSSVSFNVLWNGSQTEFFFPKKGLRQGDPISPLLFVLCMDRLSHLICDEVADGNWHPVRVATAGPVVSHLLFADDLLLFGAASEAQASCMLRCLEKFGKASGGKVSIDKSSVFFSPKVSAQSKQRIKSMTHMKISGDIGKYLGFPLSRSKRMKDKFNYIVERTRSKLANWKANSLSFAGRVTLAKSVLSSIPLYPMQVAAIPKSICHEVERIQRNFIWGHDESSHRYHSIGWEQILRPKQYGGLGFRRLESINLACGAKVAWNLVMGASSLWAEILQRRYMLREGESLLSSRPGDSKVWKFICASKELVDRGTKWQVRNGELISFFNDCWLTDGRTLRDFCSRSLSQEEAASSVADWVVDGSWDFARLSGLVSPEIISRLMAHLPPYEDAGQDLLVWGASKNGLFSLRSAYFLIEDYSHLSVCPGLKEIWAWRGAERIKLFMWRVFFDRLPTNERRSKWGTTSNLCGHCGTEVESLLHILRDCSYARKLWLKLIKPSCYARFFSCSLEDWLLLNLKDKGVIGDSSYWCIVFGVSIWLLWGWRNSTIFEDRFVRPVNPAEKVLHCWRSFALAPNEGYVGQSSSVASEMQGVWMKPPSDWMKLNVDGAVALSSSRAGCGGLLRDSGGVWYCGFSKELGTCDAFTAEQWAMIEGLTLSWDLGIRKLILESDALDLVQLLAEEASTSVNLLLLRIKELLQREWQVQVRYIPRQANGVADVLAKDGINHSAFLNDCPGSLCSAVAQESWGVCSPVSFISC
ncbi:hypothetical protein QN277_001415 [Acacia crassicarpa]|uniref:Reverse transcriptase domain-containing protein n=1 Tax=Acacia crassicarpa TaxID=499986 RepID=A0AAE1N8N5_9FABA|nr:hypothetical protein QN277_001415 [Acacia crassicarpa]